MKFKNWINELTTTPDSAEPQHIPIKKTMLKGAGAFPTYGDEPVTKPTIMSKYVDPRFAKQASPQAAPCLKLRPDASR